MSDALSQKSPASSAAEQRIVAPNMTEAMRLMGEQWGADAIMLSSRRVAEGVEVLVLPPGAELTAAAANAEAKEQAERTAAQYRERRRGDRRVNDRRQQDMTTANTSAAAIGDDVFDLSKQSTIDGLLDTQHLSANVSADSFERQSSRATDSNAQKRNSKVIDLKQTAAELAKQIDALNRRGSDSSDVHHHDLDRRESDKTTTSFSSLFSDRSERHTVSSASSNDTFLSQAGLVSDSAADLQSPSEFVVADRLRKLELGETLVRRLLANGYHYEDSGLATVDVIWQRVLKALKGIIRESSLDIVNQGGVFALTGSDGSGKTAALSKIVAQLALDGCAGDAVVIQFDNTDQRLQRIASVSGVEVITLSSNYSLKDCLADCAAKRTVLIDTSRNYYDSRMAGYTKLRDVEQFGPLVTELLCLDARASLNHMRQMIQQHRSDLTQACILTRCDEATGYGASLTAVLESELPMLYRSSGAFLPTELEKPTDQQLIDSLLGGGSAYGNDNLIDEYDHEVLMPIVNLSGDQRAEVGQLNLQ